MHKMFNIGVVRVDGGTVSTQISGTITVTDALDKLRDMARRNIRNEYEAPYAFAIIADVDGGAQRRYRIDDGRVEEI